MGNLTPNDMTKLFTRYKAGMHAVQGPTGFECTDLIQTALKFAHAKTLDDIPQPDSRDWVWGRLITNLDEVRPGDIIQFNKYFYILSSFAGDKYNSYRVSRGPQHSALVVSVINRGISVRVIEQHIDPDPTTILESTIYLKSSMFVDEKGAHCKVVVDGEIWVYQPQRKGK